MLYLKVGGCGGQGCFMKMLAAKTDVPDKQDFISSQGHTQLFLRFIEMSTKRAQKSPLVTTIVQKNDKL